MQTDGILLPFLLMAFSVGLLCVVYLYMQLKKTEKRRLETEAKYQELDFKINTKRLDAIESKLNPHLFKNILNSIQSHAYQTYFALDKLSNVLDYILYDSRNKFVSPKEEMPDIK